MKIFQGHNKVNFRTILSIIALQVTAVTSNAQQLKISDFVLFGGSSQTNPPSPYITGVEIGSSSTIKGGSVGSFIIIKSNDNLNLTGNIYGGSTKIDMYYVDHELENIASLESVNEPQLTN